MNKFIKRLIFILIGISIISYIGLSFLKTNTKKHSPEETVTHQTKEASLSVFYNRPYKKDRIIFGELVPFGKVWRTGANEATTFNTSKDLLIDGSTLPAGKYTLWTIPNKKSWKILFNSKQYSWGVNMDGTVKHNPEFDVLTIEVPVNPLLNVVEQFSIYFEEANDFSIMYLAWDTTVIAVPIKVKK
ncbi:DUF2911 domain-containing protein [Aquimarina hainanensis]|uniref:DUF2911 domain-containing protein n=1 Tax=Aquimarina hainanensis TaxID=1578017 RepID=A0ABW5N470_9FLAO|nr:DUF2911 domain-containing protein [Aquimarina sp. TRL1]QKX05921.1 DUF2911 domain-containing protein [Aquimarina sp. TRL1]